MEQANLKKIEDKWRKAWQKSKVFEVKLGKSGKDKKKKFYCLEMFPYPSGKLHMGHVRNYCLGDCIARYKRMQGYNVLYPFGYDSFGLPAENAAIKQKVAPDKWTENNIKEAKEHLLALSFSYDWNREIATHKPEYYKWNQLFFLKMLEKGLVYRKEAPVNYCPSCDTVLANEQVKDGKCWRCEHDVQDKMLEQWFVKITDYAEELLQVDKLEWPERVKIMQKNWIGKSHGTEIHFKIKNTNEIIHIFTTRADTLYGVTFMVFAPENPLVSKWVKGTKYEKTFNEFLKQVKKESKIQRLSEEIEKKGMFIGKYAINPLTNEEIPVYVGNFVVYEYGAGAVMAVPAHDQRDFEFAKKHNLKIKVVIQPQQFNIDEKKMIRAYLGEGNLVNSGKFNGMHNKDAIEDITKELAKKKLGKSTVQYKIRDWLISRQRYWGTPIPVIYCNSCGIIPVPEKDLPLKLPSYDKVKFGKGNPLLTAKEWINVKCPKCNKNARRETDTMDTFFDSSWYYLRYCSANENKMPFRKDEVEYWMPVDFYIGGIEHATGHLIYARFFTKALSDLGYFKFREPFKKMFTQGMVLKDGEVMSKSKGNIVSCDEMLEKYGADTIRLFELSVALPESDLEFREKGIAGSFRFLQKIHYLLTEKYGKGLAIIDDYLLAEKEKLIVEVTKEIDSFRINIAISNIFTFIDKLSKFRKFVSEKTIKEIAKDVSLLLLPFTPHIAEEIYSKYSKKKSFTSLAEFPKAKKITSKQENAIKAVQLVMEVEKDLENLFNIIRNKGKKVSKAFIYAIPDDYKILKEFENVMKQHLGELKVYSVQDKNKYDPLDRAGKAKKDKPALYLE